MTEELRNISNSEVTTWLSCKQQYDFAFMRNLAPKETPTPLARGTLGHGAFSAYAQGRIEGEPHPLAMGRVANYLSQNIKDQIVNIDLALEVKHLFERYMEHHRGWIRDWEILGTEERLDLKLNDSLAMPIRYDIMIREKVNGKILVGDFKFSYDFWQTWEHNLNVQMLKYIAVMQANGIEVSGGFIEEIRTRKLGPEKASDPRNLWRRTYYYPSPIRRRNSLKQHIVASLEIEEYRNLPERERETVTIPVLNKFGACKYCNFVELCNSLLDGKDIDFDISVDYVQNTYGYNKTAILEDIL